MDNVELLNEMLASMEQINSGIKILKEQNAKLLAENTKLKEQVKQLNWRLHEQD